MPEQSRLKYKERRYAEDDNKEFASELEDDLISMQVYPYIKNLGRRADVPNTLLVH